MRGPPLTAALGAALLVTGGLFDAEPLLAGGVTLVALALATGAWVALAGWRAAVTRSLGDRRIMEGEPLELTLDARMPLPAPAAEIDEPLLASPVGLPSLRRRARVRMHIRFSRRGRRVLRPATLIVRDPLGIARRRRPGRGGDEVLVLPRIEPVRGIGSGARDGGAAAPAGATAAEGVVPDGLRPYREGAPASRIHWPALARGSGLLERRLAPDADRATLVVLDPSGREDESLDAAVRATASLCRWLGAAGGCALLVPGERRARRIGADLGAWPAAWAALALVERGRPPAVAGLAGRAGPLVYVTSRPPSAVPAAVVRAGALVVAPAGAGPAPRGTPVLEVAGCVGHAAPTRVRRAAA